VAVRKVKPGKDQLVGRTDAGHGGKWRFPARGMSGKFYAKVKPRTFTSKSNTIVKCRGARSRTIKV
jgi:hypothetical protein